MRSRVWVFLIVFAVLVAVTVAVLLLTRGGETTASITPTSTAAPIQAHVPTADVTSSPTPPPTATRTPTPLVYTIQSGDTLSGVAQKYGVTVDEIVAANDLVNPDMVSVGQQIVIPGQFTTPAAGAPTATSPTTPTPFDPSVLPTLTPTGPAVVEIVQVIDAGTLSSEAIVVRNRGGLANMEEWTLSDAEENAFTFPSLTLFDQAEVRVHSASGKSTPTDLYWDRQAPAWSVGELLTLRDAEGNTVHTYIVP